MEIKKIRVNFSLPIIVPLPTPNLKTAPATNHHFDNIEQHLNEEACLEETNSRIFDIPKPQELPLQRSQRERRSVIADDYVVYLQE